MKFFPQASAQLRPLLSAALTRAGLNELTAQPRPLLNAGLIGAGLGLGLGALFMAAGMGQATADHHRAARIAEAAQGGFSDAMLARDAAAIGPSAGRILHDGEPAQRSHPTDLFGARFSAGEVLAARSRQADPVRDLDCLTQAVYFEARGETPRGQQAVAQVVLNRVKHPAFPKTVCAVVFQGAARSTGCQFSFACDGSMRRGREAGAWDRARHVAARALAGAVLPDVGKATHFHTTGVAPAWGPSMLRVAQVGLHVFYRLNPKARPLQPQDIEQAVFVSAPAGGDEATLRLAQAAPGKPAEVLAAVAASLNSPAPAAATTAAPASPTAEAKAPEAPATLTKAATAPARPVPGADATAS